jgi:hypothetical protein
MKARTFETPVNDGRTLHGKLLVTYHTKTTDQQQEITLETVRYQPAGNPAVKVDITYLIQEHADYLWQSLLDMARNNAANLPTKMMEG